MRVCYVRVASRLSFSSSDRHHPSLPLHSALYTNSSLCSSPLRHRHHPSSPLSCSFLNAFLNGESKVSLPLPFSKSVAPQTLPLHPPAPAKQLKSRCRRQWRSCKEHPHPPSAQEQLRPRTKPFRAELCLHLFSLSLVAVFHPRQHQLHRRRSLPSTPIQFTKRV